MKIRMLKDQPGSVDGINIADYASGAEYDLTGTPGAEDLAAAFVAAGFAEPADAPQKSVAKPVKASPKPENK